MTPHTIEEQISLLTAEAEGKVIFVLYDNGARSHTKTLGYWRFDCCRYEVERPLMECWAVADAGDDPWGAYSSKARANDHLDSCNADASVKKYAPFRVVHLKEVR